MRRRVTVDSTKSVRDSAESRRPSVFERLGPGAVREHHRDSSRQDKCRNWLRDGSCPYGDTCHFQHGPYSRGKDRLSDTEPPMDLRHRVESKRAERERHEREAWDDDRDESPVKEEKRRRSRRDKDSSEKKKKKKKREMSSMVVKQASEHSSSSSDEGNAKDWPAPEEEPLWNPEDPDFEFELTLERRRQQLQRELERIEIEEGSDRVPLEEENSTTDEKPSKVVSPPRKKHGKKKRSHSNSSKHERQAGVEEVEGIVGKSSKSHKKHKHNLAVETSPRVVTEKSTDHHAKKKSRKSKSPLAPIKIRSPSPPPVKTEDVPKKHKSKEGKKKDKTKKRKYQSDISDDNEEDFNDKKKLSSTYRSQKKSGSKHHLSQSPKRSPSHSPPRRAKQRDPSPSTQSESSQSTRREKSPESMEGSHASESPRRSTKKKRYQSPSPPPKRSRQPTPETQSSSQSRHSRRASPDNSRHGSQSINRGQSPSYKKRARSTSIGSSHRSQSPKEHGRSPSPSSRKQAASRGRGSPSRASSSSRDKQRRPPDRMSADGGRPKSSYDKYDNKRQYSQDRSRSSSIQQQRDGRPTGRDVSRDASSRDASGRDAPGRDAPGRDAPGRDAPGRDALSRDRGYLQGKDSGGSRSAPAPPGRNERVSRKDEWEKKRIRDIRDTRDDPYSSKRARSDTRGNSPSSQKHRPYMRDEDSHSADRQTDRQSGRYGNYPRSSSAVQQNLSRQDRDRSGSRRPDYQTESGHRGRDNTPDFRRAEHLGELGRANTPDSRRSDYGSEGKVRGRDNTPDLRRPDFPVDVGRKGRDATPDKRYSDYHMDRKRKDETPGDMKRPEHLSEGCKGRDNTPDSRRTPDKRRSDKPKGDGYGKYDDKTDVRKYDDRGKDSRRVQQRDEIIRGAESQSHSRGSSSSRAPPTEPERAPEPQQPEIPPINVTKAPEQAIKREKLKTKTDSIESKISSSASEAKGSPALERKFSKFSEPFSDWSDEGSDGLLTRSSTPLEHERHANRQQRPSRAEPSANFDLPGPTDVPINGAEKPGLPPEKTEQMAEQNILVKEPEAPSQTSSDTVTQEVDEPAPGGDVFQTGDAYEEISDDELDDILEENQEDENQAADKNMTEVDWNSLMKDIQPVSATASQEGTEIENEAKVSILEKFSPANVLMRVGVSRALAGPSLMKQIEALCRQGDKADDKESVQQPLFEEQLGAFNATAHHRYEQRKHLLTDIGPCRRALCARRDIMIRKQLRKDKDIEQVFSNPVIDPELYRLSLQLFRTKRPSLPLPFESKDSGLILKSVSVTS